MHKIYSDAPRNMELTPRYDIYYVGKEIVCNADGNPPTTIHWVDNQTGELLLIKYLK